MDSLSAGFWGAFFGTAALMLAFALAAWLRSRQRVALMAGLSAVVSAAFAFAFLGGLPLEGAAEARVLAHVAVVTAVSLALMLMSTLGLLRQRAIGRRSVAILLAIALVAIVVGWFLEATMALALSAMLDFAVAVAMLVIAIGGALRGDRVARNFIAAIFFMVLALAGLCWIAVSPRQPWPVHAMSALAGTCYLAVIGALLWARYSYLVDLSEVMAHGPSYDPVTRMRSHSETGQMVGDVFFRREADAKPIGIIAICIANLYALENLHGRAAFNHALFICAGRLRRCVPTTVEMGRLGEDGFLLLVRNAQDMNRVAQLARRIATRLSRPVTLSTSRDVPGLEAEGTAWVAAVGIGVLGTTTQVRPSQAVSTARAMARTAWSYESRLAFYDQDRRRISELPREGPAEAFQVTQPPARAA